MKDNMEELQARIEALADRLAHTGWRNRKKCEDRADAMADAQFDAALEVRSLLDSGEERECPDCDGSGKVEDYGVYTYQQEYTGSGQMIPCCECDGSGRAAAPPGEEQVCPMCRDLENVEYSSGSIGPCPTCRATPSPALHREGRGDFIGDDLSGVHTCHAGCPCQNRATGEDCPDCGGSGVKGENPIGLSRSCLKCGGSGRATPSALREGREADR